MIRFELTNDEATALLYGWEVTEFPGPFEGPGLRPHPLGEDGEDLLTAAKAKLRAMIDQGGLGRFAPFTSAEREAMRDGLIAEAEISPCEDPSFPARIATARALMDELAHESDAPG